MVTIFSTTKIDRKNKILYGFPEPQDYTEGTNSLGELCLKNLAANPNYVVLVRKKTTSGESIKFNFRADRCNHLRRANSVGLAIGRHSCCHLSTQTRNRGRRQGGHLFGKSYGICVRNVWHLFAGSHRSAH